MHDLRYRNSPFINRLSNSSSVVLTWSWKVHDYLTMEKTNFWWWACINGFFRKLLFGSILFTSTYATVHIPFHLQYFSHFQFGNFRILLRRKLIFLQYKIWSFWSFHWIKIRKCFLRLNNVGFNSNNDKYLSKTNIFRSYHQHNSKILNNWNFPFVSYYRTVKNTLWYDLFGIFFPYPRTCFRFGRTVESYQQIK